MEHITNKKIKITLPDIVGKQYDVVIGKSLNEQLVDFLKVQTGVSNIVIITDEYVEKLYGKKLLHNLRNSTLSPISLPVRQAGYLLSFPDGEQYKTQETVTKLQNQMFALACGRDTLIIALGGGVVGDIAGFVASTYMRGIPYIQMPTTLLAMVDSSVGGKTGIDNEFGKNLVGAFWQPLAVLADVDFLHTLPEEHIVSGLVEAIKMFLTHDKTSFQYVHDNYEDIINLI